MYNNQYYEIIDLSEEIIDMINTYSENDGDKKRVIEAVISIILRRSNMSIEDELSTILKQGMLIIKK